MKRLIGILVANIVLAGSLFAQQKVEHDFFKERDTLDVAVAHQHIGEEANFCDKVQWASKIENHEYKPTLVKLGKAEPGVTLVIWEEDAQRLFAKPLPELFPVGTQVCVTGSIKEHKGSPQIEVAFKDQVHWVGEQVQ